MTDNIAFSRRNRLNLRANDENATALCQEVFSILCAETFQNRKRRPHKQHFIGYTRHLEMILMDLFSANLTSPTMWVGYSRGKENFIRGGSYWNGMSNGRQVSSKFFLDVVDFLNSQNLIEHVQAPSGFQVYSSRMRASHTLLTKFREHELTETSIKEDDAYECIVVRDENKRKIRLPLDLEFDVDKAISNLNLINRSLKEAFINLNVSDQTFDEIQGRISSPDTNGTSDQLSCAVDFTDIALRRVFAHSSFQAGGRFYGGWWQKLPSEYRRFIEIDGVPTIEMDFATLQPRMLYAQVNRSPPDDSYLLDGWAPDLRNVVKKAFNQLVNSHETSRNEQQWHRFAPDIPHGLSLDQWHQLDPHSRNAHLVNEFRNQTGRPYRDLIQDLLDLHSPIDQFFFSGAWQWTQNLDSQIAEKVLLRLLAAHPPIVALPIHD